MYIRSPELTHLYNWKFVPFEQYLSTFSPPQQVVNTILVSINWVLLSYSIHLSLFYLAYYPQGPSILDNIHLKLHKKSTQNGLKT